MPDRSGDPLAPENVLDVPWQKRVKSTHRQEVDAAYRACYAEVERLREAAQHTLAEWELYDLGETKVEDFRAVIESTLATALSTSGEGE